MIGLKHAHSFVQTSVFLNLACMGGQPFQILIILKPFFHACQVVLMDRLHATLCANELHAHYFTSFFTANCHVLMDIFSSKHTLLFNCLHLLIKKSPQVRGCVSPYMSTKVLHKVSDKDL